MRLLHLRPSVKNSLRGFAKLELPSGLRLIDSPCFVHTARPGVALPGKPLLDEAVSTSATTTASRSMCRGELHAAYWVNRLAGKFHVGMIYEMFNGPAFFACADKQWSAVYGPRVSKHNNPQRVGSGAEWRSA